MSATLEQFEPSANGAGKIGTNARRWGEGHFAALYVGGSAVAPVASPTFTGTPAAPTAASNTNSTQIATTEFVQTLIALAKARTNHTGTQTASTISDFDAAVTASTAGQKAHTQNSDTKLANGTGNEVTAADLRTHLDDATKHRQINDAATSTTETWSSSKIQEELDGVTPSGALAFLDTVGTAQIDNDAITADKIATGAVGSAEIAAAAVTGAKVEGGSASPGNVKYWGTNASGVFGFHSVAILADTAPQLGGTLDTNGKQVRLSKGADVASASNLTLGNDGNYFDITGTTAITSISTKAVGTVVRLHFDGALVLTHHATDLILPGSANITTAAGDEAEFVEYAIGDWRCTSYSRANGLPIIPGSGLANVVDDTTPQLGGTLDANGKQIREAKGANVASASSLALGDDGNYFTVTGTTTITSISTKAVGTRVTLRFSGILTLTHHATDLILPGGANITTAAGDAAQFVEYASGDWVCIAYQRASGAALVASSPDEAPLSIVNITSDDDLDLTHSKDLLKLDSSIGDRTLTIVPNSTTSFTDGFRFLVMKDSNSNFAYVARGSGVELWKNGTDGDITLSNGQVHLIWRESLDVWRVLAIS